MDDHILECHNNYSGSNLLASPMNVAAYAGVVDLSSSAHFILYVAHYLTVSFLYYLLAHYAVVTISI